MTGRTDIALGYCQDDGGARAAGWTGKSRGDCVTRALALATRPEGYDEGVWYQHCYDALADATAEAAEGHSKKAGRRTAVGGVSRKVSRPVYEAFGLRRVKLPAGPRPTFEEAHAAYGNCVVGTTGHVACLSDGALRDTADCRTYEWEVTDEAAENYGLMETRDRKAQSVWVPEAQPPMPTAECIARVDKRRAKHSGWRVETTHLEPVADGVAATPEQAWEDALDVVEAHADVDGLQGIEFNIHVGGQMRASHTPPSNADWLRAEGWRR